MMRGRLASLVILGSAVVLGGCISGERTRESGIRVGDETLKQFEAGTTTEAWLLAVLGKPTSVAEVKGLPNTRVLRYATQETSGGVIGFFSGSSGRNVAVTYFIVTDGVVTRFWADRAVDRTLLGSAVERETGVKQEQ